MVSLFSRSLLSHQIAALRTRPPSSGNPGTMLKAPIAKLIKPRHASDSLSGDSARRFADPLMRIALHIHESPITALVIGPTIPIQNSAFADNASFSMFAIPPNAKRVIDLTG